MQAMYFHCLDEIAFLNFTIDHFNHFLPSIVNEVHIFIKNTYVK
jgi:hypothetical protein